jgi:hypothetical protein
MPRANPALEAFNSGELGGQLAARLDFRKYPFGAEVMRNFLPAVGGGMMRRPGSRYVATAADSSTAVRLVPFVYSTTQAYILEFQNGVMRFYRNQGQITVADTDAAVSNGTFDSNITGWDDNSSGSASIAWARLGAIDMGTFSIAKTNFNGFGDASSTNTKNAGMLFLVTNGGGDMVRVRCKTHSTHTANGNVVARVYTNNAGSPGTQVGGDSDTVTINAGNTEFTFTWSSNTPSLSDATSYWVVLANTDTSLNTTLDCVGDQGANYASGRHDTITSISDGSGSFNTSLEWRFEVLVDTSATATGVMGLVGSAGDTASAEQDITTTNTGTEHSLQFWVRGAPGDTITFRVGSESTANDVLADTTLGVGYHTISFTPDSSPFYIQFDNTQAKTVYIDDVALLDNEALQLVVPYATAELFDIKHTQSADVIYFTHPSYPVYKLGRSGHTTWSLTEVRFEDGPYLTANDTSTTLTPSAATGLGITLTFSSTTGVNSGAGLTSDDIGRIVRYSDNGTRWGWAVITDVTDGTHATADVIVTLNGTGAVTTWRLGAWSATTGYPACSTFFEQRFVLGSTTNQPQTFWLSQSAGIENMTPDNRDDTNDGSVEDDDALDFTLAANEVNVIRWIAGGQYLFVGTTGGEWLAKSSGAFLTPTDIDVKQHTTHGSADIQPVRAGHAVLYVHYANRKIHELVYDDLIQGLRSPDLTILAPDILTNGAVQMAFQEEPHHLLWVVRGDGILSALTYERDEQVVGWSRHIMGGSFSSGDAVVESVAVIPGNDGAGQTYDSSDRDEVWMVVKRTINSATVRYIEFLEGQYIGPFRDDYASDSAYETALLSDQKNAFYVDCGLTYDGASTDTITGLSHLEGETVAVWADGKELGTETVSSGQIMIDAASSFVHVGLPYTSTWKSLKNQSGAARGTPMGQRSRIHDVSLVLKETLAGQIGPKQSVLHDIVFPAASSGSTKPLYTGEREVGEFDGDWERDPRIYLQDNAPAPISVLAVLPRVTVNEL